MVSRVVPLVLLAAAPVAPLAGQGARVLSVGRPVGDSLTSRDPVRRRSHAPYHVWRLDARRGQRLVLDLVSSDFDAYLVVRDSEGNLVGSDDDSGEDRNARLHLVLSRDGPYQVFATTVGDSARGYYTLSVGGWETPAVLGPGAAGVLAPGCTETGLLEPGDELSPDGAYLDRWVFDARPGARVRVELRSEDLDAYLTVLGPEGVEVGSDDDGLGERNSVVGFRAAAAGRYTILASSYGDAPQPGVYRVSLLDVAGVFTDPGATAEIRPDEVKEGQLEAGDVMGERGLEDRWTFRGQAGQVVRLDATSGDFDAFLVLRSDEMVVGSNDDGGEGNNARIVTVLPRTGTYTAVVSAFSAGRSGGRYSLQLTVSSAAAAGRASRIAFGQRLAGRLERGDATVGDGGYQDEWEFEARAGQDVTIELRSGAFDTYLELQDEWGNGIAENDDGLGEGTDSYIAAHLDRGGRFRIQVRAYGDHEATGLYELALGVAGPAARPGEVLEALPGETYSGRLEEGDSVMGDDTYADVFLFRAAVSGRVRVELRSSDFDAYLILQDGAGRTLSSDDDGGSGTDSQITWDVVAGRTYRILANSYGAGRQTGTYRLLLRPAD